jgi:hypothetical protein
MTHISTTTSGKNRKINFIYKTSASMKTNHLGNSSNNSSRSNIISQGGFVFENTTPDGFMLYKKRK